MMRNLRGHASVATGRGSLRVRTRDAGGPVRWCAWAGGRSRSMSTSTRIYIPMPLRPYAAQQSVVEVEAASVGEALRQLVARHSQLTRHLYDENGRLRRFVNVYKNDEDVRHLQDEGTPLAASDSLSIVPTVAGGAGPRRGASLRSLSAAPAPPPWATGEDGLPPLSQGEL